MKEPKGINALSIAALSTHLTLLSLIGVVALASNTSVSFNVTGWLIVLVIIFTLVVAPAAYPVQLLLIRRNYYRNIPASPAIMTWTHICRILQLLQIIYLVWMTIGTISNIYVSYRTGDFGTSFEYLRIAITFVMCVSIPLNLLIFFKGWRFLKLAQGSYVDEVMTNFDEPSSKQ